MKTETRAGPLPQPEGGARVLPVGGGKGGVGKTFLVANLAAALARGGRRVVAVDGDLEGANLHTCLGVPHPRYGLADYVAHREEELEKLLVDTPIPNLRLLAATHGNIAAPQPSRARRVEFVRGLRKLDADFVLVDLGAGAHPAVIDYFVLGGDGIVVLNPEPTSVENVYGFLRAAFYRRLRLAMLSHDVRRVVTLAMDQSNELGIRTPFDLLREVQLLDAAEGARFVETVRDFRPRLLVNDARTAEDIKLGFLVRSVCRKYFGIDCEYLGYVNHEEAVRRSVKSRRPLVVDTPRSDAAIYIARIARKLAQGEAPKPPRLGEPA